MEYAVESVICVHDASLHMSSILYSYCVIIKDM